jgi:peptidoglycan hydrolase-like protein with peptidoglycan-binding domain
MLFAAGLPAFAQPNRTAQAIAALDMSAVPNLDRDSVRILQRALRDKAMDPGPLDGGLGPRTREAIRAFQQRYGMKPTGIINNQLLFAVGAAELATSQ